VVLGSRTTNCASLRFTSQSFHLNSTSADMEHERPAGGRHAAAFPGGGPRCAAPCSSKRHVSFRVPEQIAAYCVMLKSAPTSALADVLGEAAHAAMCSNSNQRSVFRGHGYDDDQARDLINCGGRFS
jgi:hypothetical protein